MSPGVPVAEVTSTAPLDSVLRLLPVTICRWRGDQAIRDGALWPRRMA